MLPTPRLVLELLPSSTSSKAAAAAGPGPAWSPVLSEGTLGCSARILARQHLRVEELSKPCCQLRCFNTWCHTFHTPRPAAYLPCCSGLRAAPDPCFRPSSCKKRFFFHL